MLLAKVVRRPVKRDVGPVRVSDAGKRYGERAQEIAWRVVHSELSRSERARK